MSRATADATCNSSRTPRQNEVGVVGAPTTFARPGKGGRMADWLDNQITVSSVTPSPETGRSDS